MPVVAATVTIVMTLTKVTVRLAMIVKIHDRPSSVGPLRNITFNTSQAKEVPDQEPTGQRVSRQKRQKRTGVFSYSE